MTRDKRKTRVQFQEEKEKQLSFFSVPRVPRASETSMNFSSSSSSFIFFRSSSSSSFFYL
ncbi:hypothetical protein E2C01_070300 [Portunus trituberculatus]|uniref:Uncharacterized protein n=1 Tax=Portunus trituberculatus TaxID=210409 RepID=A0A5B7HSB9_PORTR|nr:hypothetical protein [Portunus trituberculatus]